VVADVDCIGAAFVDCGEGIYAERGKVSDIRQCSIAQGKAGSSSYRTGHIGDAIMHDVCRMPVSAADLIDVMTTL
jgi:hypothetical protein